MENNMEVLIKAKLQLVCVCVCVHMPSVYLILVAPWTIAPLISSVCGIF